MTAGSTDPRTAWSELLREKRSLAAIVRDAGRLCIQDSVDLVLDVCDELAMAHANGIVHGDLGLHRVRTMWPRRPGDVVDIWTLDADDTGAIDFRAAFQAPALAPEQRTGRVGDRRSDIWAVGAILHALIGGQPPSRRPPREVLAGIPRALLTCIEQCLADSPDDRPSSIDDVAGMLASYASNSPERFQQLARRRIASLKAKHVPEKVAALGRLDESAVRRESGDRILAMQPIRAATRISDGFSSSMPSAAPIPRTASQTQRTVPAPVAQPSYHSVPMQALQPMPAAAPVVADAPYPHAPSFIPPPPQEVPTRGRANTTPLLEPVQAPQVSSVHVDSKDLPTVTAAPVVPTAPLNPNVTQRMQLSSLPSSVMASAFPAAPAVRSITPTPPPVAVSFDDPPGRWSAPIHHPTSIPPMSIDASDPVIPGLRTPSFSDLAEYRAAKRTSRRNATWAVFVAAAVIALGLGFGSRMLADDRAALHAAEAAAVQAPPPAPVEKSALPAALPAASAPASAAATPSASPTASDSASATAAPKAPKARRRHHASSSPTSEPSADDRPDTAPADAFNSALGKHDSAPANALENGLK